MTKKEKADGQKKKCKRKIGGKRISGEINTPVRLLNNVERINERANEDFELWKIDIRAAFLQVKQLDREVFLELPNDIKREGYIWKLKKPLYGLYDASKKFC